ncbi:MAG TPA: TIGR01777 family oxidoreductase [Solirubrobacteraceae bacterium]|nr:TIGR01777 family oxidoreductase [Solirubrobacteraceae bacterium]
MCALRVTVTGATGLIGGALVGALLEHGAEVTVLARDPARARQLPALRALVDTQVVGWESSGQAAPAEALAGRDAIVHLAGEPVAQRWSASAKRAIRDSRVLGTRNLVAGLAQAQPRPGVLVSASAIGYYGPHGEEPLDEETPPGGDFLGQLCAEWEAAAAGAAELGMRVVHVRVGVVLDRAGGALAQMLPPFRLGLGGPVAGGRQYVSWVHLRDVVALLLAAVEDERWSGPVNATAPEPVTNREFSRALGRALGRPALLPVPALALRALYGEMADVVIGGARVLPAKALVLGYEFAYPQLDGALRAVLA